MKTIYYFRSAGAAAAAPSFAPGVSVKVKQIKFTLSAAGGENVTGSIVSGSGTPYNATLVNESMNGITSLIKTDVNTLLAAGDAVNFAYTNALSRTWGLEIAYERVSP